MDEIKDGDVVYLKSGSPAMTVLYKLEGGNLFCSWFDGKKEQRQSFSKVSLTTNHPENMTPPPPLGKLK